MKRKSKTEVAPTSAIGIVEAEREAAHKKTMRLRAERLAREEAEAKSAEPGPAAKRRKQS